MSDAARSFKVTVQNYTPDTLVLQGTPDNANWNLAHGVWFQMPPTAIAPGATGAWECESNGFATGTQGSLTYATSQGNVIFSWDNPYSGSNEFSVVPPSAIHSSNTDISGDNAATTVTLKPA